jgi:hypothetical protein
LPLEMLTPLRMPHVAAVSRDLSAPVLASRFSRTANDPCTSKKGAFGAAVDPRVEVVVPGPRGACAAFKADILDGGAVPFGKEWAQKAVLLGTDHVPSPAEWQRAMAGSGAFVVSGPGAFHEQLMPSHIAPLKLETCTACLLFDRIASDAASRRLAKEANTKGARQLALEKAHASAALLSLAGVRTVLTNQWAASAQPNHELLVGALSKMNGGASLAEALAACARDALVWKAPVVPVSAPEPVSVADVSDAAGAAGTADGDAEGREEVESAPDSAPTPASAPAPAHAPAVGTPMWSILANPIVYGLPNFTVG